MTFDDDGDLVDLLESIADMRANGGEMDLLLPVLWQGSNHRTLERELNDMRRFGYVFRVERDFLNRICRVRLLEQ